MSWIPNSRTTIGEETERPLVSFCLFAYKQEQYIQEAVEGAFAQTYSPLEIILSDDGSPDHTFDIMRKMAENYKGPHKIILNRNEKNIGLVPHFNKVLFEISSGNPIVLAAGDDISLPERTELSCRLLSQYPEAGSLSFDFTKIDSSFKKASTASAAVSSTVSNISKVRLCSLRDYIVKDIIIYNGCARTFDRKLLDIFGPIPDISPEEDAVLALRAVLSGLNMSAPQKMVLYRVHSDNITKKYEQDIVYLKRRVSASQADISTAYEKHLIETKTKRRLKRKLEDQVRITTLCYSIFGSTIPLPATKMRFPHLLFTHFRFFSAVLCSSIKFSFKVSFIKNYFRMAIRKLRKTIKKGRRPRNNRS